ncbi:MAG TPA: polyprenyl synthetase family protein, partial [Thermoanaerobaculia bacterium]|nr:polyprenyl synthetase family protein [Thermoanaerobaculia bacterium]
MAGGLAEMAGRVSRRLPELLAGPGERPESVHQAMHYALTGPGKRIRPVLTLVVANLFGARAAPVLDLACAVEMVHACSLILDDLPSMDNASLRRGRPT